MGGSLIQLAAYGAENLYIMGNPQITFFKSVYRKHTNFAMEALEQKFDGNTDFGNNFSCAIGTVGELVHNMYLEYTVTNNCLVLEAGNASCSASYLPAMDSFNNISTQIIKEVNVEIGGQVIDRHSGEWLETYTELVNEGSSAVVYSDDFIDVSNFVASNHASATASRSVGRHGIHLPTNNNPTMLQKHSGMCGTATVCKGHLKKDSNEIKYTVPLQFWFNRNVAQALPLISIGYSEVVINVKTANLNNTNTNSTSTESRNIRSTDKAISYSFHEAFSPELYMTLWVQYIYLDEDEKRLFAEKDHEYLIEQVQQNKFTLVEEQKGGSFTLNFNHPVKYLVWMSSNNGTPKPSLGLIPTDNGTDFDISSNVYCTLILNGKQRFMPQPLTYFTRSQIVQNNFSVPKTLIGYNPYLADKTFYDQVGASDSIAVYSFCLNPKDHQPSGICNFTKIDNAELIIYSEKVTVPFKDICVFAVNYNLFRIIDNVGGLVFG